MTATWTRDADTGVYTLKTKGRKFRVKKEGRFWMLSSKKKGKAKKAMGDGFKTLTAAKAAAEEALGLG